MKNISPSNVFEQLSIVIPKEFHENIIIIGSLAAGYFNFIYYMERNGNYFLLLEYLY